MEINQTYANFLLKEMIEIQEKDAMLYHFVHEKTGAELCFMKTEDTNKTFCISFKTIPSDDTGVFHILEHSVLCGSKKYPLKDPFVELLKGSMQTFLNAMTAPDKTMYPVSSRNTKDFMNLMSVYLDAVFAPMIYENPNIFYQEGWHYALDEEGNTSYQGVVLNEMKGAYSAIDETIVAKMNEMLFPDNCYHYESGGKPEEITNLTYEHFLAMHKKYYHPSNAFINLDGDIENIEEVLAFIDEEYLSKYERNESDFSIPMQSLVKAQTKEYEYEFTEEDATNKTVIAIAKIICDYQDVEKNLAWIVLSNILVANNESPFTKAILDKGLAEDVEFDVMDNLLQPWAILVLRNTEKKNFDEAKKVLYNVAKELIKDGLDHEQILAALNQIEFKFKEKRELAGIGNTQTMLRSWLYGGKPDLYFHYSTLMASLRKKLKEGYFEKLLEEFLFDEEHLCTLIALPSKEIAIKRKENEDKKLQAELANIEKEDIVALNEHLLAWQMKEDTEEEKECLPRLYLEDLEKKPREISCIEKNMRAVDVRLYPEDKSGIHYFNAYFNVAGITKENLPALGLFVSLLTHLPTEDKSVEEIQKKTRELTGTLRFILEAYAKVNEKEACKPMLVAQVSSLAENDEKAISLLMEIAQKTIFTKENILPILKQELDEFRQAMISSGNSFGILRVGAHFSSDVFFRENTAGYSAYQYLSELENNEEALNEFIMQCELFKEILFAKERATLSTNTHNEEVLSYFIAHLSDQRAERAKVHYPLLTTGNEKMYIPGGVSYVVAGRNMLEFEDVDDAVFGIIQHILSYDYLWNEVRVKGGAYGTGVAVGNTKNCVAYSYRDPDPKRSLESMKKMYQY